MSSERGAAPGATRPAVVVTGGSEGIGRAIAARFLAHGHCVLLVARRAAVLDAAAQSLASRRAEGAEVLTLAQDIADEEAAGAIDALLLARGFHVEVLVNNAAIGLGGPLVEQEAEQLERLVGVNVAALTRLSHHYARAMLARGHGSILNIGSVAAFVPGPNQAAYYASKAYVQSLSEALAEELSGSGVQVAVISPGPVDTRIHARMGAERALYRWVMPSMSPEGAAFAVYWAYRLGRRAVVPGPHYWLASWALRVLPRRLSVPVLATLLRRR